MEVEPRKIVTLDGANILLTRNEVLQFIIEIGKVVHFAAIHSHLSPCELKLLLNIRSALEEKCTQ